MRKMIKKTAMVILNQNKINRGITKYQMPLFKKTFSYFKLKAKNKFLIVILLSCIALVVFVPKGVFFFVALTLATLTRLFQKICPFEIGIELTTLFTACFSITLGLFFGVIFAFLSKITGLLISNKLNERWAFIAVFSSVIIALISGIFPYERFMSFALFGFFLALVYDIIFDTIFALSIGIMNYNIIKRIVFYITHLYFNYFLFFHIGENVLHFFCT